MTPSNLLGVPPCGRAYFLLLRQKKVAKEKATPGSAPFGSLALLGSLGDLLNSPAAQTTQAESPQIACVAQRLSWGPQRRRRRTDENGFDLFFVIDRRKKPVSVLGQSRRSETLFRVPMWSAEQRRRAGGSRRGLFEARRAEFRSRPVLRVAQGSRRSRPRSLGSPSSLATFFLAKQEESTPALKAEPPRQTSPISPVAASKASTKQRPCNSLCLLSFGQNKAKESKPPRMGGIPS
jgi:hypothetical protein